MAIEPSSPPQAEAPVQAEAEAQAPPPTVKAPPVKATVPPLNTFLKGNHAVKVTKLTGSEQLYNFLVSCSCGTEGRFNTIEETKSFVESHFQRRGLR